MAISHRALRVLQSALGLAIAFPIALFVFYVFETERWNDENILVLMTIYGVVSASILWLIDRHGGGKEPPTVTYVPGGGPVDYIS